MGVHGGDGERMYVVLSGTGCANTGWPEGLHCLHVYCGENTIEGIDCAAIGAEYVPRNVSRMWYSEYEMCRGNE